MSKTIQDLEKALAQATKGTVAYKLLDAQLTALKKKQAKPEIKPEVKPEVVAAEPQTRYFQAIGTLKAIVTSETDAEGNPFFCAHTGGNKYRLNFRRMKVRTFLKHYKPGTEIYLRVYPYLFIMPRIEPELQFQAIAWNEKLDEKWEPENIFILRGLWQFIPQFRFPVISVKRNFLEKEQREKLIAMGDKLKGKYIPLMWSDAKVNPFRFNPKTKEQSDLKAAAGDRYFIEVKAKFMPHRQAFGFQSLLSEPTLEIPRYLQSPEQMERKRNRKTYRPNSKPKAA